MSPHVPSSTHCALTLEASLPRLSGVSQLLRLWNARTYAEVWSSILLPTATVDSESVTAVGSTERGTPGEVVAARVAARRGLDVSGLLGE